MIEALIYSVHDEELPDGIDPMPFAPPLAAAVYPFLLMLFHTLAGPPGAQPGWMEIFGASAVLLCALAVPILGLTVACRPSTSSSLRRLAYASVVAPTLYVFLGVVQGMAESPIPDPWIWCILWVGATLWAILATEKEEPDRPLPRTARWRVAHGTSAAVLTFYVLFHITNHLTGLVGPEMHQTVMDIGRSVYRAPIAEPVLVLLLLFQVASGVLLAWRWSARAHDFYRSFQIASGIYLAIFIIGHMNSVFVYARTYLGIPTDWNFATGAPTGLLHDPWNIRLLPHYALGVFFVLSHLVAGLRLVLIAHAAEERIANRLWLTGVGVSAAIAAAVIAGMCGVRL